MYLELFKVCFELLKDFLKYYLMIVLSIFIVLGLEVWIEYSYYEYVVVIVSLEIEVEIQGNLEQIEYICVYDCEWMKVFEVVCDGLLYDIQVYEFDVVCLQYVKVFMLDGFYFDYCWLVLCYEVWLVVVVNQFVGWIGSVQLCCYFIVYVLQDVSVILMIVDMLIVFDGLCMNDVMIDLKSGSLMGCELLYVVNQMVGMVNEVVYNFDSFDSCIC